MRSIRPCVGSGHLVLGPDDQDGTVYCGTCGRIGLPIETTTIGENGLVRRCVPEHKPSAAPHPRRGPKGVTPSVDQRRRNRRHGER